MANIMSSYIIKTAYGPVPFRKRGIILDPAGNTNFREIDAVYQVILSSIDAV